MNYLSTDWFKRSSTLVVIAIIVSWLFSLIGATEWAIQIDSMGPADPHGEKGQRERPPAALLFILPFVKQAVFILVPAIIFIGIKKVVKKITRKRQPA